MIKRDLSHWSEANLREAVNSSVSARSVLKKLGLKPAGGNYNQFKYYIEKYQIDTSHFNGRSWRKGLQIPRKPVYDLSELLIENSFFQSSKLKKRLIDEGLKKQACEECGWAEISIDGRIPVELDHII